MRGAQELSDSLNLAQTATAVFALLAAAYSIVLQPREMAISAKLNAAAALFEYYNAKVSSLRGSIVRDTGSAERARVDPLEKREVQLAERLRLDGQVVRDLEELYQRVP